jgi:hypothetical protein
MPKTHSVVVRMARHLWLPGRSWWDAVSAVFGRDPFNGGTVYFLVAQLTCGQNCPARGAGTRHLAEAGADGIGAQKSADRADAATATWLTRCAASQNPAVGSVPYRTPSRRTSALIKIVVRRARIGEPEGRWLLVVVALRPCGICGQIESPLVQQ